MLLQPLAAHTPQTHSSHALRSRNCSCSLRPRRAGAGAEAGVTQLPASSHLIIAPAVAHGCHVAAL